MCRAAEQAKAESDASSTEKPALPETVLDQVVSGLDEDDMAAIGEQLFLRFRAWPAFSALSIARLEAGLTALPAAD